MHESLGSITHQAMAGSEQRRVRRDEKAKSQKRLRMLAGVAMLATAAGILVAKGDDSPSCQGTQNVPVKAGDTLNGLKYEHIQVPEGSRVDLYKVETQIKGSPVETDKLQPGDTVVMPRTCQ